jgi:SAM-dependent methyltransferase
MESDGQNGILNRLPELTGNPALARGLDAPCSICGGSNGNKRIVAKEMMFGFRDEFNYLECHSCGCLQLRPVPENLEKYYPADYFPELDWSPKRSGLKKMLRHRRAAYCLRGNDLLGKLLVRKWGRPRCSIFGKPDYYQWLCKCGVDFSSKILDVGCGSGILLRQLLDDGFTNLTGVDPFIKQGSTHSKSLRILKDEIYNLDDGFDMIMLHHTFEHMSEPVRVLTQLFRSLKHGRYLLIRIPVAGTFAYKKYGPNWAQLDAPRHLFLHTVKSIKILAGQTGFELADVIFDSNDFQFWASEQYVNGIPLKSQNSYAVDPARSSFSPEQIAAFGQEALKLNAAQDGDSACFYLFKP